MGSWLTTHFQGFTSLFHREHRDWPMTRWPAISPWLEDMMFAAPCNQTWPQEIPKLHGGCQENPWTQLSAQQKNPAIRFFFMELMISLQQNSQTIPAIIDGLVCCFSPSAAVDGLRQSEVNMSLAAPIAGFVVGCWAASKPGESRGCWKSLGEKLLGSCLHYNYNVDWCWWMLINVS